jgi:cysteine desulfurase
MGEACRIAAEEMAPEAERILALRRRFLAALPAGVSLNGDAERSLPGILNLRFDGVDGELLLMTLKDLAVSTGSACTSASLEPSYVLREIGLDDQQAHSSLRFSLGRYTTEQELDFAATTLGEALHGLRRQTATEPN